MLIVSKLLFRLQSPPYTPLERCCPASYFVIYAFEFLLGMQDYVHVFLKVY